MENKCVCSICLKEKPSNQVEIVREISRVYTRCRECHRRKEEGLDISAGITVLLLSLLIILLLIR